MPGSWLALAWLLALAQAAKLHTWYTLSLSGNTSLVHSRLPDFLNYLKINLGGLTETDYEAVTVNSVSYVPSLLVNISFIGPHSLAQLVKLAERNDTVLGEATQWAKNCKKW